jgi:hypothetical protein
VETITFDEKLLEEDASKDSNVKDIDEEITLAGFKNAEHRRACPQEGPENASRLKKMLKCDVCTSEFETKELLVTHEKTHQNNKYSCKDYKKVFHEEDTLNKHLIVHTSAQWNCMDCSFQGNC